MKRFLQVLFTFAVLMALSFFIAMMVDNESPQQTWARIVDQYDKWAGIKPPPIQAPVPLAPAAPKPTQVVKLTPEPAPAPIQAPSPAVPIPPAPPDPVAWLRDHRDRWPKKVILLETTKFPVIYNGKVAGSTSIPGGNSVEVVSIEGDNVNVLIGENPQPVPINATDFPDIAKEEMGKAAQEPLKQTPGTNVVQTPVAPPGIPTQVAVPAPAPAPPTLSSTTEPSEDITPPHQAGPEANLTGNVDERTIVKLTPVILPQGEKSPLITSFVPCAHEVRNATSGLMHPGILQTKAQLDTMQRHVRNGDQPWASAFAEFSKVPACGTKPRIFYAGWTEITHSGPNAGGNFVTVRMAKDGNTAYKQAVMWYITGDETYRLNALKIIRDYCAIKTVARHWDSQIRWGVASYQLCCAAEVLRYSDGNTEESRWTDDDTAQFSALMKAGEDLVAGVGYWMNQHGFSTAGEMGTAIFLDDKALYEKAVERTTVNSGGDAGGRNGSIEWQMRLVTENYQTHEKVRPQVQLVEMIRDEAHAWINVAALSTCCQTIYNQGTKVDPVTGTASTAGNAIDAFDFLDNRLLAGTDYITRFTMGEPVTWIPIDMGTEIKGAPRSYYDLGILYNHYKYIEKWSTSDPRFRAVAQAYESLIPEPDAIDFPCASTLLLTPDDAVTP